MKNNYLLCFAALGLTSAVHAQDLATKIPSSANVVLNFHGSQMNDLMSIKELNETYFGQKIIKELSRNLKNQNFKSLSDAGINLTANSYFFLEQADSVTYYNVLLPINNSKQFYEFISKTNKRIKHDINSSPNYSYLDEHNGMNITCTETHVLITFAHLNLNYFYKNNNSYGLKEVSLSDYYDYNDDNNDDYNYTTSEVMTAVMAEEVVADTTFEVTAIEISKTVPVEAAVATQSVVVESADDDHYGVEEATTTSYDYSYYDKYYEDQRIQNNIEDSLAAHFAANHQNKLEQGSFKNILSVKSYKQSLRNKPVASYYIANVNDLYNSYLGMYYSSIFRYDSGMEYSYGTLSFGKQTITGESVVKINADKAKSYKKLQKNKVNKKLLQYINPNENILGITGAINTQAYLEQVPEMYAKMFSMASTYGDEANILSDLFTLIVDEKAIGQAIKGDAIFLMSGINKKSYQYKTYDYDPETFESSYTYATKEEMLPDFLYMMSTDNPTIMRKIMDYFNKKEFITKKNGVYSIKEPIGYNSPYTMHFTIRDGIVFAGTSYQEIANISMGKTYGKLPCKQRKAIRNSTMAGFFWPHNLKNKIKTGQTDFDLKANNIVSNLAEMQFKTQKMRCKKVKSSFEAKVPTTSENGMQYFIHTIDKTIQFID